jgi:cytochrome c oxidase assembly protein subunit 15
MDFTGAPRALAVPRWFAITTHVTSLVLVVVLLLGVTTTANGPHSGDPSVVRHGFDVTVLEHLHATPAYLLFALTLLLTIASLVQQLPIRRWLMVLLGIELVQIGIGLYQSRTNLPPLSVGVHMVVAALLVATMVVVVTRLKTEKAAASAVTQNA